MYERLLTGRVRSLLLHHLSWSSPNLNDVVMCGMVRCVVCRSYLQSCGRRARHRCRFDRQEWILCDGYVLVLLVCLRCVCCEELVFLVHVCVDETPFPRSCVQSCLPWHHTFTHLRTYTHAYARAILFAVPTCSLTLQPFVGSRFCLHRDHGHSQRFPYICHGRLPACHRFGRGSAGA
jgi:hypothetical protein